MANTTAQIWAILSEMRRKVLYSSAVVGSYGVVLLCGAFYMNQIEQGNEVGMSSSTKPPQALDPIFARGMASKLSTTVFPGLVLLGLAYVTFNLGYPLTKEHYQGHEDHLAMSKIQGQCNRLMARMNLTRLLTNVFAVLLIWRMTTFHRELFYHNEANVWFNYALVMAGWGLCCGFLNTLLYQDFQKTYRSLKKALQQRFKRSF